MPRKIDTPIIVARYGDKVAGWAGDDKGGRLSGDTEWVQAAKDASDVGMEFTLYNGISLKADISDPKNPAGAFAALAWYAKERILIKTAPEGMMESLGLLETPEEVDLLEDYPGEITEEDREFIATHVNVVIDGQDVWLPLSTLQESGASPDLLSTFLKDFAKDDEPETSEDEDSDASEENQSDEPDIGTEDDGVKVSVPAE